MLKKIESVKILFTNIEKNAGKDKQHVLLENNQTKVTEAEELCSEIVNYK